MDQGPEQSGPFFFDVPAFERTGDTMIIRIAPSLALAAALALGAVGCAPIERTSADIVAIANLARANGDQVGQARLTRAGDRLVLKISASGMTPGTHGLHLHSVGKSLPPEFTSAGGHLNPGGNSHGMNSANPSHLGDLPNLEVGADGKGSARNQLPGNSASDLGYIFDADGTAIVLHANADDYRSDPTGNAGPRVACGVLRPLPG